MRGARCWLTSVLFTSCLLGASEAPALPTAGEFQLDVGSELRICVETTGCEEPVSIAGVRYSIAPDTSWILRRELSDGTYDLYEGYLESAGLYRIHTVINSPDLGPYASSDDSYLTFLSDTVFQWTGSFSGFLSCDSFGLDPTSEDCWSSEPRDFELINVSATLVPEPSNAMLFGSGVLGLFGIQGALRKKPGSRRAAVSRQPSNVARYIPL
jgi:hypothetical protein